MTHCPINTVANRCIWSVFGEWTRTRTVQCTTNYLRTYVLCVYCCELKKKNFFFIFLYFFFFLLLLREPVRILSSTADFAGTRPYFHCRFPFVGPIHNNCLWRVLMCSTERTRTRKHCRLSGEKTNFNVVIILDTINTNANEFRSSTNIPNSFNFFSNWFIKSTRTGL